MVIYSSINRWILIGSIIAMAAAESSAAAVTHICGCSQKRDLTAIRHVTNTIVSEYCSKQGPLDLVYSPRPGKLTVTAHGRRTVLEKIPPRYNPAIVGGEQYIRFLPRNLQIYERRNLLMYLSAERSSGGNGGGQCGSGLEIHLNVMNINTHQRHGRVLIDSCYKSIELARADDRSNRDLHLNVVDGRLALKFITHPDAPDTPDAPDRPTGYLSQNFREIEFPDNVTDAAKSDDAKNPTE